MYIHQIYTACLAQASYYIESNGEAAIIDPIRDPSLYIKFLKDRKATLKYIFETHFHADFVSGHLELARLTKAKIIFGPNANTLYDVIVSKDKQEFTLGEVKIQSLHTPGHTLESTCYLLLSKNNVKEAVFTGDTLFIGEVGRPDLAVNPDLTSKDLAELLYNSLHNILMKLPDHVVVYPGHGAGSACGKNISSEKTSTIGEEKIFNYALQKMSKNQFTNLVLDGILTAPEYFKHDVTLNKDGYAPISEILSRSLKKLNAKKIIDQITNKKTIILDVRMPNDFEKGFIPGSINVGKTGMFAPWVATLIPPRSSLIIVCYPNEEKEIISRLARVGYENIIGYTHGIDDWVSNDRTIDFIKSINPSEMSLYNENKIKILDVRKKNELELGLVKDSIHIPLDEIYVNINKLKKTEKYLIYCAGGYRSMIACSILKSKGYHQVHSIYGGFKAISENIK